MALSFSGLSIHHSREHVQIFHMVLVCELDRIQHIFQSDAEFELGLVHAIHGLSAQNNLVESFDIVSV